MRLLSRQKILILIIKINQVLKKVKSNSRLAFSVGLILSLIFFGSIITAWVFFPLKQSGKSSFNNHLLSATANAAEIYPQFSCPCCGKPLDPNNICCGMAKERIDFIISLINNNLSEDEITLAYVKKYGLNSLIDKNQQKTLRETLIKTAPANRPIISLTPSTINLDNVSQKGGKIFTFFTIKNEGQNNLVINKIETSCGCTSASIVHQEKEGPIFTMPGHGGENPANWQVVISPNDQAQLKVYYDPNVHQDFRGPAIREITVFSNDPIDFEKKVKVELNQVD